MTDEAILLKIKPSLNEIVKILNLQLKCNCAWPFLYSFDNLLFLISSF